MKLADGLLNSARREPGKTAIVFNGREYSYSQVKDGVYAVASALNQTSLKPGDNVGLWSGNCPEYVEVLLGASLVGAVPELYNARWSESVICDLIESGNVRILFVGPNLPISAIASKFPHIQIIVIGDEVPNGAQGYGPFVASVPPESFFAIRVWSLRHGASYVYEWYHQHAEMRFDVMWGCCHADAH